MGDNDLMIIAKIGDLVVLIVSALLAILSGFAFGNGNESSLPLLIGSTLVCIVSFFVWLVIKDDK